MVDFPQVKTTLEEYMALPESNRIIEYIDGEIIMTAEPLDEHQGTSVQLILFIMLLVKAGTLRHAPSGLRAVNNVFEPDIFWISPENTTCQLEPNGRIWIGAPDLVIEILSPSTAYRDRGIKYLAYEAIGVREYWLVDPEARFVEVYRLEDSTYKRLGIFQIGETFTSNALNSATVSVDELFAS